MPRDQGLSLLSARQVFQARLERRFTDGHSLSRELNSFFAATIVLIVWQITIQVRESGQESGNGSMKAALENDDEQFLLSLQRLGSVTIQDLCDAAGVTATAIRQRLGRLQTLGLIDRTTIRAGRGRPHHTYQITDLGRRHLGDNYSDLARLLWNELQTINEADVRERVTGRIRDAMVRQYGANVSGTVLQERFAQLGLALSDRGFSVEVGTDPSLPILRENHCPYHELAQQDRGICELEQQVFEQVLGVPLTLSSCCRDGHHCCEFQPT